MEIFSTASSENTKNETNETFSNEVSGEEKDVKEIVVFLLLGILIIFVNATSIVVFWRRRFFLRRSTILLINLTTADLLVGFILTGIFTMLEAVRKWEILAATKVKMSGSHESEQENVQQILHKTCSWEVSGSFTL